MKPVSSSTRFASGQVAVIVTLAIATVLGSMALAIDLGVLYFNWVQLQKAADAAALAGSAYYGPYTMPAPSCSSYGTAEANGACQYALGNGAAAGEISAINVNAAAGTVQVLLVRNNVPAFFARLLGINSFVASAGATAQGPLPINTITNGLFPIGLQLPGTLTYGQSVSLYQGVSPGNWGFLDLQNGCTPAGSLADSSKAPGNNLPTLIASGSNCGFQAGTSIVFPEPGNKANSNPVSSAIQQRVGSGAPLPADPSSISPDNPQLVTVPIVNWNGTSGSSSGMTIQGFAEIWLTAVSGHGSSIQFTGEFIKYINPYLTGAPGGTPFGGYSRVILIR